MPTPTTHFNRCDRIRNFGRLKGDFELSNLTQIQTESFARFLQLDEDPRHRADHGIEGILREIFPVFSYDQQFRLEYVKYELGKPRYTPTECRQLRLTYGRPFRVWLKLVKEQSVEEEVYLGDIPIMLGGGEFIINGAERVVVSQLHRSPGVDFVSSAEPGERKTYSCRIIPERGSWIELNISKREALGVRIDQSGKFSAITLLRAMDPAYSTDAAVIRTFYQTKVVKISDADFAKRVTGKYAADDLIYPVKTDRSGEIIAEAGQQLTADLVGELQGSGLQKIEIIEVMPDPLILNSILEDTTHSHQEALLRIYARLRPGNPPQLEKAIELFHEKFFDVNRYRLGRVGRFRINRKFEQDIPDDVMTLRAEDFINAIRYVLKLRLNDPSVAVDDIDNLGNRRLRTIDELAADEIRKGFLKLRRTVQERMSVKDAPEMSPRTLVNPKSVSAAIDYFFGRSELSQVVDQTNPLSTLTHERRLSALGPGGLNRKRAGFEVRDVHISHYGRICPIETPEGTNIGLISSLSIFAKVDDYGFLITPYRVIKNAKVTDEVRWLRADEESNAFLAPADTPVESSKLAEERVLVRHRGDFVHTDAKLVDFMDVAPCQMVGVSAALIPFLEHDDANRALMGSNMQRQAVPLLVTEPPVVGTGMERAVAENSGMLIRAEKSGTVGFVDATRIELEGKVYPLTKYTGLNE
ncbi:MAG: DNA-directed RNA polymerase subunit beta, partial [Planctomycetota bacterium]|nr:DNA-directed RNA polymerase subunit beta [Planctomycetota bacterium]